MHIQLCKESWNQYVMSHLKNHLWFADLSKGFLILGQLCQGMLQLGTLLKVFTFIKPKPTLTDCDLKTISHRLAIVLCLTTGQRDQTIRCLNLDYIKISGD